MQQITLELGSEEDHRPILVLEPERASSVLSASV